MTPFGPLQPHEVLAILATAADVGLSLYGVLSGRAKEGNFIYGKGRRAVYLLAVLAVVLHLVVRWRLSDPNSYGPKMQGAAWLWIAAIRGSIAAWNVKELVRASKSRR